MSVVTIPTAVHDTMAEQGFGQTRYDVDETSDETGDTAVNAGAPARWTGSIRSAEGLTLIEAGAWEGMLLRMQGKQNHLAVYDKLRPLPQGTARGAPQLSGSHGLGLGTLALRGLLAGTNLLTRAETSTTFLAGGWSAVNATFSVNAAADPVGGNTAMLFTRTATGNHYAVRTHATATAGLTFWLAMSIQAGTLTGDVTLRLRDGADTEWGSMTVTPTSDWQVFKMAATFGLTAASNVNVYLDPVNDAGAAGDTLKVWLGDLVLCRERHVECTGWLEAVAPPPGQLTLATQVQRTGTGNAYVVWFYTTTSHASKAFVFSLWLRAGSYSGTITLFLRDGAGTTIASVIASISGVWQKFFVTGTFGATPAAGITVIADPNVDSGAVGETYEMHGAMLEQGALPGSYEDAATFLPGDWLQAGAGVGSHYCKVTEAVRADRAGNALVPVDPPLRKVWVDGTAVTLDRPVAHMKRVGSSISWGAGKNGPVISGHAVDLLEQW